MKNKIEFDEKMCKHKRNKKYYEHLAKIILEKFLPQRFYDLEISDRPDIRQTAQIGIEAVSYTHLRAHETGRNLVCRLLLEKKKKKNN